MYTSHGHHIPGTDRTFPQPLRARCGGLSLCAVCARESAKVLVKNETNHHHILIALTPQDATNDQKKRNLLTNAIAWTFFGDEAKEIVQVDQDKVELCRIAAERCMVALREYERISNSKVQTFEEPFAAAQKRLHGIVEHAERIMNSDDTATSVSGGTERESTPDEQEPENPSPSQGPDAIEAPEEGVHGI